MLLIHITTQRHNHVPSPSKYQHNFGGATRDELYFCNYRLDDSEEAQENAEFLPAADGKKTTRFTDVSGKVHR